MLQHCVRGAVAEHFHACCTFMHMHWPQTSGLWMADCMYIWPHNMVPLRCGAMHSTALALHYICTALHVHCNALELHTMQSQTYHQATAAAQCLMMSRNQCNFAKHTWYPLTSTTHAPQSCVQTRQPCWQSIACRWQVWEGLD